MGLSLPALSSESGSCDRDDVSECREVALPNVGDRDGEREGEGGAPPPQADSRHRGFIHR